MDIENRDLLERYNIVYIVSNVLFITTLSFYVVLEEEIFNKYYIMVLFIPIYINYYLTFYRDNLYLSLVINFIYIQTKLIFMLAYFNYIEDVDKDETAYIIYCVILYLLYSVEIVNMVLFYFKVFINRRGYENLDNLVV